MTNDKCATTVAALALAFTFSLAPARAQQVDDFERGKQLLAQGDARGAAAALKRAAERRKNDGEVWYQLGLAFSRVNKQKDARKAFEKAVKLRPDSAEAHAGLAAALLMLDKKDAAEREASRALALDANVAAAHYVVGATQGQASNYRRAAQEAEEALRLQPNYPDAAWLLGDALLNLYVAETTFFNEQYPVPSDADEETRKPILEKRDAALEPFRARMRAAAERLEALAGSRPGGLTPERARELAETLRVYGSPPLDKSRGVFRQADVLSKATITYKPEPGFTEKAREKNISGVVRLRAVLAADGTVKHILVIKGLPEGLTRKAVEAARQIRFKPATKDGRPVSQFVILEYNFNVY
ncbi:MAG TPA: TonB family protein [Pyrinomonadaceae bacterium]